MLAAVETVVVGGGSKAVAAYSSKMAVQEVVVGKDVVVEARSAGMAAASSKTATRSKHRVVRTAETLGEGSSSSKAHLLVVAVCLQLPLWRSLSIIARHSISCSSLIYVAGTSLTAAGKLRRS